MTWTPARIFIITAAILFAIILTAAGLKKWKKTEKNPVALPVQTESVLPKVKAEPVKSVEAPPSANLVKPVLEKKEVSPISQLEPPERNCIELLFNRSEPRLPFVETIAYKSRASWMEGRQAWLADYAAHFKTSRHFIARSLNGTPDYFKQDITEGSRFNILKPEKNIQFHLVIDVSRHKMWFYSYDADADERILLKTYPVGLGRLDSSSPSGCLTPLGQYTLGDKVGIYKPKSMGIHAGHKTEMVQIFGSRWLPFDQEVSGCTAPSRGLGIHGVPWLYNEKTGEFDQQTASIGKYESDGCIRMATDDIEELFAIIITKRTVVQLVKDFWQAKLLGKEAIY